MLYSRLRDLKSAGEMIRYRGEREKPSYKGGRIALIILIVRPSLLIPLPSLIRIASFSLLVRVF